MEYWDGKERRSTMFDKDFYDQMKEVHTNVGHISNWIKEHKKEEDERHQKLNDRVVSLENNHFKVVGASSVLGAISGFLARYFTHK